MRPYRITPEEAFSMVELYRAGLNMRQISSKLRRSLPSVHRVINASGVSIRPVGHPKNTDRYALAWKLRQEGNTYREIADKLGLKSSGRAHTLVGFGRSMESASR